MSNDSIADYEALKPQKYHCIHSMRLNWSSAKDELEVGSMFMDGCPYYSCRMELIFCAPGNPKEGLRLRFEGIRQLKMPGDNDGVMGPVSVLHITDVTSNQWEGVRYYAMGNEMDGDIDFFFRNFHCEIILLNQ